MTGRRIALGILGGAACFALGLGAARLSGPAPAPPPPAPPPAPRILIDPSSLQLLPDAALHLDLPQGIDAGALP